jgi:hypothetical protein
MISLARSYGCFSIDFLKNSISYNVQDMRRSSYLIKNNAKHCHLITGMWRSPEPPKAAERIPFVISNTVGCVKFE